MDVTCRKLLETRASGHVGSAPAGAESSVSSPRRSSHSPRPMQLSAVRRLARPALGQACHTDGPSGAQSVSHIQPRCQAQPTAALPPLLGLSKRVPEGGPLSHSASGGPRRHAPGCCHVPLRIPDLNQLHRIATTTRDERQGAGWMRSRAGVARCMSVPWEASPSCWRRGVPSRLWMPTDQGANQRGSRLPCRGEAAGTDHDASSAATWRQGSAALRTAEAEGSGRSSQGGGDGERGSNAAGEGESDVRGREGKAGTREEWWEREEGGGRGGELLCLAPDAEGEAARGTQSSPPGLFGVKLEEIPERYWTVGKASLAFVLANMDKVNLSVAIIPMSNHYAWSASTAGLVQSSFFWGYALSLIPSGWMAQRFTGQRMLRAGVLIWSIATAAAPSCGSSFPLLLLSRVAVGFGEGVAPPAATDLVARTMPAQERTRAVSAVFNGFNVGSILGLMLAPFCIQTYGWESVFYIFGAAGIIWSLTFNPSPLPQLDLGATASPAPSAHTLSTSPSLHSTQAETNETNERVPWMEILRNPGVWALVYVHFCNNWGHFCILAWLPTFYSNDLHLNLSSAALVSMIPPVLSILVSAAVAPLADSFVRRGTDVTLVRKVAQGAAFMVPAACMAIVACEDALGLPSWLTVGCLSLGLGFSACAYAGLYCAHQDMSRRYASILLGLTTTVGAIPGIVGVPLTGFIFDATNSWMASLFAPSIFFYVSGTLIFALFGDCRPQHFGEADKADPSLLH